MSKICDMGKAGLKDILDAIVFFMSLYPAPLSKAIMLAQLGEDFSRTALNTDLDRLCKKGFISKLKDKRNIFLKILPKDKFHFLGDYVALKIKKNKNKWDRK